MRSVRMSAGGCRAEVVAPLAASLAQGAGAAALRAGVLAGALVLAAAGAAGAQARHPTGALAVNLSREETGGVTALSASLYVQRPLLRDSGVTALRLSLGFGASEDAANTRDTPFEFVRLGLRRDLATLDGPGRSVRLVVAVAGDVGVDVANPFDSVSAPGVTLALGRRTVWLPTVDLELSARFVARSGDPPVALSWQAGYLDRLSGEGRALRLTDRLYTSIGVEVWVR